MTIPSFLFGATIATLFGFAFHFWRGGSGMRLVLYLGFAWIGFWGGHYLSVSLGWDFASYGPLHIGLATISSLFTLVVGYWLSLMQSPE
jgi:hypothetical protein